MNIYKVILLGESNVGKTSLLNIFRYRLDGDKRLFTKQPNPTSSVDIVNVNYKFIIENKEINVILQLWDTGGTETYRSTTKQYYRDSKAVVFCFDLTNGTSFDQLLQYWRPSCNRKDDLESDSGNELCEKCIFTIVGTKLDLCYDKIEKMSSNSFTYITNDTKQIGKVISMVPTLEVTEESESDGTEKPKSPTILRRKISKNIDYSVNNHTISEDFKFFNLKCGNFMGDKGELIISDSLTSSTIKKNTESLPTRKLSSSDSTLNGRKKAFHVFSATETKQKSRSKRDSIGEMMNSSSSSKKISSQSIEENQQKYINEIYKIANEKIVNNQRDIHEIFLTSSLESCGFYGVEKFFMNLALVLLKENGQIAKAKLTAVPNEKEPDLSVQKKQSSCCS